MKLKGKLSHYTVWNGLFQNSDAVFGDALGEGQACLATPGFGDALEAQISPTDVIDGQVDEWEGLFFEPSLTALDFSFFPDVTSNPQSTKYGPSDLDFRIWLGWSDSTDRFYSAAIIADDLFRSWDGNFAYPGNFFFQDHVNFMIDGDHDGSPGFDPGESCLSIEDCGIQDQAAQFYEAIPISPETPNIDLQIMGEFGDWWSNAPFSSAGGSANGMNPTVWIIEFYITPFDKLIIAEAESSVVSDLRANKIVGFSIQVTDIDEDEFIHDAYILGNFTGKRSDLGSDAHTWVDGVLLPGDDKSVVEDKAWGRIKASLLE